jgi:hypothetical protein
MNKNNTLGLIKNLLYIGALIATAIGGYFTAITSLKLKVEDHEQRLKTLEHEVNNQLNDISKQLGELKIIVVRLEERVNLIQETLRKK